MVEHVGQHVPPTPYGQPRSYAGPCPLLKPRRNRIVLGCVSVAQVVGAATPDREPPHPACNALRDADDGLQTLNRACQTAHHSRTRHLHRKPRCVPLRRRPTISVMNRYWAAQSCSYEGQGGPFSRPTIKASVFSSACKRLADTSRGVAWRWFGGRSKGGVACPSVSPLTCRKRASARSSYVHAPSNLLGFTL